MMEFYKRSLQSCGEILILDPHHRRLVPLERVCIVKPCQLAAGTHHEMLLAANILADF